MAQAIAMAQGISGQGVSGLLAPGFSGPALPPLTCPLPGEAQGRNPRITTATAMASFLAHAVGVVVLVQMSLAAPPAAAPPVALPPPGTMITLMWDRPVVAPTPEPAVDPAPAEPLSVPPAAAPAVLRSVAEVASPTFVPPDQPAPALVKPVSPKPVSPKPASLKQVAPKVASAKPPAPVASPVAPSMAAVPDAPAVPAPSSTSTVAEGGVPSSVTSGVPSSPPVAPEPSLLRGEEGVPVSRDARYLEPPKPPEYPRRAVQLGLEGTVVVRALVEGGGVPRTVRIVTGSGVDSLDAAAIKAVSGWKFAVSDHGSLWVEIPVQFRLR